MQNLSDHTDNIDFCCELLNSLLMRGSHMGEITKPSWLNRLLMHAIWADLLYFLYLLLQFSKS
jgi:hypothetical protein